MAKKTEQKSNKNLLYLAISLFILGLYILVAYGGLTGAVVGVGGAEIDVGVLEAFDRGEDEVSVIVILKDDKKTTSSEIEEKKTAIKEKQAEVLEDLEKSFFGIQSTEDKFAVKHQYTTVNAFSGEITKDGLKKLKKDSSVEKIVVNGVKHIFLDHSVPKINADDLWDLTIDDVSIDGTGQTVCVIDTGIDYNHEALSNKYLAGYDFVNDDEDPLDDHGHGTHVAGIIASNDDKYTGVAPGAKIVAMKVCSASGSCTDADVVAGIDWCINNASIYDISVISISLGGLQTDSYCDDGLGSAYAASINQAVAQNISVVLATGNTAGAYTNPVAGIAVPACVQSATKVTATDNGDNMASFAFRHANFPEIITAPGVSIKSLNKDDGTMTLSGTSMSTPHVSGVIVLLRQYWDAVYQQDLTPAQVETRLQNSGVEVDDSAGSGLTIPRIDILAATQPSLSFTTPTPEHELVLIVKDVTINLTSDLALSSALLEWTYPNGTTFNYTLDELDSQTFSLSFADLEKGIYSYQVYGFDPVNNFGTSETRTFTIDNFPPTIEINLPADNAGFQTGLQLLNVTALDEHLEIDTVLFEITEGNGSLVYTAVFDNVSYVYAINMTELSEEAHTFTVIANDTFNNVNNTETITFIVDRTVPEISLITANNTETNLDTPEFSFNVTDNFFSTLSCTLYFDNTTYGTNDSVSSNAITTITANAALPSGSSTWYISCEDGAGNTVQSAIQTILVDNQGPDLITINNPNNGERFNEGTEIFDVTVNDTLSTVDTVLFNITEGNGSLLYTAIFDNVSYTYAVNLSALSEEAHTFTVLANDTFGNLNQEVIVFTIDRSEPEISGVSADPSTTSATITWSTNEDTNSSLNYGDSSELGNVLTNNGMTTAHSLQLGSLDSNTLYYFEITSCDSLGYCATASDEFTTDEEEEDDDDSSSSSDSSGTGSGDSGDTTSSDSDYVAPTAAEESVEEAEEEYIAVQEAPPSEPTYFSETVSLSAVEPLVVTVTGSETAVTQLSFNTVAEKEIAVSVTPADASGDLPESVVAYQYLDITAEFEAEELNSALITFTVPRTWYEEQLAEGLVVALFVYEEEEGWQKLSTRLVEETEDVLTFEATTSHFSSFMIAATPRTGFNLVGATISDFFVDNNVPSTAFWVILGVMAALIMGSLIFLRIRRNNRLKQSDLALENNSVEQKTNLK